jgi:hypothetical protein
MMIKLMRILFTPYNLIYIYASVPPQAIDLIAGEGARDQADARRRAMQSIGEQSDTIESATSSNHSSSNHTSPKVTSGIFREISAAYKAYVVRHTASKSESDKQGTDKAPGDSGKDFSSKETTAPGATSGYVSVTLKPGEMLYLPPFWIHEVLTSVNIYICIY